MNYKFFALAKTGKPTLGLVLAFLAGISIFIFPFSLLGGENIAKVFAENHRHVFEIAKNGFLIFLSALFTALSNGKASAAISFLRTFGFITVLLLAQPVFLSITVPLFLKKSRQEIFILIHYTCVYKR